MSGEAPKPTIIVPESPRLVTLRAADIEPVEIRWLWPQRMALGKLLMIAGDPGLGKSLFTIDLAARVSRGDPWPVGGGRAPLGSVLIISAEDDPADTIVPRLIAAGADLERVHILAGVRALNATGEMVERELSLERDIELISESLATITGVVLVIVDPISAYLGHIDSHRNTEVRSVLAPLAKLAQEAGATFALVSHLNKASGSSVAYRVSGSIAFTAAVRASVIVVKDRDDPLRRLVLPGKNNLGSDAVGALAYRVGVDPTGRPRLEFEPDAVMISAEEAMDPLDDEQSYARDEAEDFLNDFLKDGAVAANEVVKAANMAGISKRTLERAKAKLGVYSGRREFSGGIWFWSLRPLNPGQFENTAKAARITDSHNDGGLRTFGDLRSDNQSTNTNTANDDVVGDLQSDDIETISKTAKTSKTAMYMGVDESGGLGDVGEEGAWSSIL